MVEAGVSTSGSRRRFLRLAAVTAAVAVSSKPLRGEPQEAGAASANSAVLPEGATTFAEVWQTVWDRFYDPHLHGLDWPAVRERYGPDAAKATSEDGLA